MTAYINIGTNIGDRRSNLEQAVAAVCARWDGARCSDIIESDAWGYESENRYLNIGMAFESESTPNEIMEQLLDIEIALGATPHRKESGEYADRTLDIDLIAVDDMVISSPMLTLPHPRMHLRDFVLVPMLQLAPQWRHPVSGLTINEMIWKINQE